MWIEKRSVFLPFLSRFLFFSPFETNTRSSFRSPLNLGSVLLRFRSSSCVLNFILFFLLFPSLLDEGGRARSPPNGAQSIEVYGIIIIYIYIIILTLRGFLDFDIIYNTTRPVESRAERRVCERSLGVHCSPCPSR